MNNLIKIYNKFKIILAIILLVPFLWFGIKAGWSQADSDFPNYYVSAQLLLKGNLHEAYDVNLFNKHIKNYNDKAQGLFVMYPPSTAIVALPLTYFDLITAKKIWLFISLCALFGLVLLFTKLLEIEKITASILLLAAGFNLYNDFMLGQVYVVMIFFILLGWYNFIKNNKIIAGLAWGWVAAIKFLPLFFIPFLLYKKHYKICIIIIFSVFSVHLITFILGGHLAYIYFIEVFRNNYLLGQVANDLPNSIQYQSIEALLNILQQIYNCPAWLCSSIKITWKIVWIMIAFLACLKHFNSKHFLGISIASTTLLLLLFENGSASYHLLFAIFAVIIFLQLKIELKFLIMFLFAFAAMGFLPFLVQQLNLNATIANFSRLWCLSLLGAFFFIGLLKQSNFSK